MNYNIKKMNSMNIHIRLIKTWIRQNIHQAIMLVKWHGLARIWAFSCNCTYLLWILNGMQELGITSLACSAFWKRFKSSVSNWMCLVQWEGDNHEKEDYKKKKEPWSKKIWWLEMTFIYCKRCYFRGINFSRFAAQKHIRGLLNSRWADAYMSFLYCTKLTSFNEWYILQV